ncbi:MAG: hypothetical protein U9O82_05610 [Thermodesulfobacteriota bacterium]|nr:hypothetical protein [Thermodesulfobacteriota bacterium]
MKFENILIQLFTWLKKRLMEAEPAFTALGIEADKPLGRSIPPKVPVSNDNDINIMPIPIQDEISGQTIDASLPKCSARSIRNLRNAVIWSEILAPPLALREDE